jgi:phospholipid-translocating ATPase
VCRCSPTQKAIVAENIKNFTGSRIACVGDGGNDVAMIQKADVGLGIVGKEGKQASLAADFSINRFKDIKELIIWHGRLSYKRSASLSQFVVHRGMIISFIQAIFTVIFFFVTIPIFNGYLIMGYSTYYTSLPIFSLVLDEDVSREKALRFPALYKTLQKGRQLNMKTFLIWTWKSIF